ncbi:hypothetical protein Ae201684_008044 [Aphanomyces euteiches]|uniref:Mbre TPR repeat protein n=1 Tax=Aphanomyces euteiches TaxID=100861 RepID=A0A6G0X654_9STRA|nr:hypothetical protein Ae201684_008044 [Aphanomyces euteiches]
MPDEQGARQEKPLGLTLGFFKRFIEIHGGREAIKGLTTGDVCMRFLLPYTAATKLSLVEHVSQQPDGHLYAKPATWFVSHAWSYLYLDVVDALDDFFQENGLDDSVAMWFCTFCNNQHEIQTKSSLRSIGNVVMVMSPWNCPITLKRTWCVFEVYASIVENARFEIAMGKSQLEAFLQDMKDSSSFFQMLTTIQSEKSETTIPSDRDNIFRLIQDEVGFTKLDRMVFEAIEKWVFRTVEREIERAPSWESKARLLFTKAELAADIGQMQEAASASQEAYDIYREINDDTLSDMWMALAQLAVFLRDLGHSFEEVESMFINALTHLTGLLTKKHVDTLGVMSLLGQFYMFHGKYYSAEPVLMECFELRRQVLGEDHLGTRVTMSNISTVMRYQKRYEEALQWAQRCYDIECRVLGADHPESYRLRNEMGLVYRTLGHFDLAEEHLNNACRVCLRIYGPNHPHTLISQYTLGENYRLQGKYSEAEEILLRCLKEDDANMRTKEYCRVTKCLDWSTW